MDIDRFWEIIEKSRTDWNTKQRDGNMERQLRNLEQTLSTVPPNEIRSFNDHFNELMTNAYRWDLWGVAYIIGQGCSDDGFFDFRNWLISMGRGVFERALADPQSVAEAAIAPGVEDVFFEGFQATASEAYEQLTGRQIPVRRKRSKSNPSGKKWVPEDLPRRFPRVSARFPSR